MRDATVLPDGSVRHEEHISVKGSRTDYPWVCICRPGEHDHAKTHAEIKEKLVARDKLIDALHALVGQSGITDCNIQIRGPRRWDLYVSWLLQAPGLEPVRRVVRESYKHPEQCLDPASILDMVDASQKEFDDLHS